MLNLRPFYYQFQHMTWIFIQDLVINVFCIIMAYFYDIHHFNISWSDYKMITQCRINISIDWVLNLGNIESSISHAPPPTTPPPPNYPSSPNYSSSPNYPSSPTSTGHCSLSKHWVVVILYLVATISCGCWVVGVVGGLLNTTTDYSNNQITEF